jgi:type II secretory ATPase GspE/PulE/Tfp pilus assembly ATPase PilB-like protein
VGEVRDKDVANICLNAANTGHLVFATLHTNNAVLSLARLKSLEVDQDVLGSVLLGILAQRLIRTVCQDCCKPDDSAHTVELMKKPFLAGTKYRPNCDYTGYRGRRMIYELLEMTPEVRRAIETNEPPSVIASKGMSRDRTMYANALRLVAQGITTTAELERVASEDQ